MKLHTILNDESSRFFDVRRLVLGAAISGLIYAAVQSQVTGTDPRARQTASIHQTAAAFQDATPVDSGVISRN